MAESRAGVGRDGTVGGGGDECESEGDGEVVVDGESAHGWWLVCAVADLSALLADCMVDGMFPLDK